MSYLIHEDSAANLALGTVVLMRLPWALAGRLPFGLRYGRMFCGQGTGSVS